MGDGGSLSIDVLGLGATSNNNDGKVPFPTLTDLPRMCDGCGIQHAVDSCPVCRGHPWKLENATSVLVEMAVVAHLSR